MLTVSLAVAVVTLGIGLVIIWPVSMIVGAVSASNQHADYIALAGPTAATGSVPATRAVAQLRPPAGVSAFAAPATAASPTVGGNVSDGGPSA
jgi:hypothetical protein